jgi:glycosyltransferase involved in cell wall biosynthesis
MLRSSIIVAIVDADPHGCGCSALSRASARADHVWISPVCALQFARPMSLPDVLCFSHLRWNFVYQRPQHLLGRCARDRRVFFFEEPVLVEGEAAAEPRLVRSVDDDGVIVLQPHLAASAPPELIGAIQRELLDELIEEEQILHPVLWYYTPMALVFTHHLEAGAVVYDCMDELAAFKGAPTTMQLREQLLMKHADVVFTGGHSLYQAKRDQHLNIHPYPSSVDVAHFGRARARLADPPDQRAIPHPRVGFFGVIDERTDLELLAAVAAARPDLQLVMVGPVVKIDPATLPQAPNLHWLGGKTYGALPEYIAGWDVAMMPFARNEATRFISPTKTPEYLAAGRPVVSTSIRDVVQPYGALGLARIADAPADFIAAVDAAMREDAADRRARADALLAQMSWDQTWREMWAHVQTCLDASAPLRAVAPGPSQADATEPLQPRYASRARS